jgi:hypothetical protein
MLYLGAPLRPLVVTNIYNDPVQLFCRIYSYLFYIINLIKERNMFNF